MRGSSPTVAVAAHVWPVAIELSAMLVDSLERQGARAVAVAVEDGIPDDCDAVVVFWTGRETRVIEQPTSRRRPFVALWSIDPLPPPGIDADTLARGLRYVTVDATLREGLGGAGTMARSLVPARIRSGTKRMVRRVFAGRHSLVDTYSSGYAELDRQAYMRLHLLMEYSRNGQVDHIMVTNSNARHVLGEFGIDAVRMPIGYHPMMGRDEHLNRDVEVLYLGSTVGDRMRRLETIEEALNGRGIAVTRAIRVYGAERAALLNRAQIALDLRNNSWHPTLMRFVLAGACGAMVVTEAPCPAPEPFVSGTHFVEESVPGIPDRVMHYLADPNDGRAMVENMTTLLTRDLTMDAVAAHLLTVIR